MARTSQRQRESKRTTAKRDQPPQSSFVQIHFDGRENPILDGSYATIDRQRLLELVFDIDIGERLQDEEGEAFNMGRILVNGATQSGIPLAREPVNRGAPKRLRDDPWLQEQLRADVDQIKERLNRSMSDAIEGFGADHFIPAYRAYSGSPGARPGAKEAAKEIVETFSASERAKRSKRWGIKTGGDRRSKAEWQDTTTVDAFRRVARDLKPLWKFISDFHKSHSDDSGWMAMLKESSRFQRKARNRSVPHDLLKRLADGGFSPREREPSAIALEHARRELKLPEVSSETLRKYYSAKAR